MVGDPPIGETVWYDTFTEYDKDTKAAKPLALLRVLTQQDATAVAPIYFPQNTAPKRFTKLRTFEGSLVGLTSESPRSLYYSMAGRPQSWPEINVIDSFPFDEYDEIRDCVSLGAVLLIASKGLMMRLTSLPRVVSAIRDASRIDQIRGAPGCVGRNALTAYSVSGSPMAAWISEYGLYATDGDNIHRLSDSIDWSVFDGISKTNWVLHWDKKRLCLIMSYSTESGTNDRYYLVHMAPEHFRAGGNNQPKWTGPHYGKFNALASGQVSSTHRLYGGHVSNGIVYTMDNGGTDSSAAYSGTQVPLIVKTGKIYDDEDEWSALDARLYHTDFGNGQTCTVAWEPGSDDEDNSSFTLSQSVSLHKHQGTQFDISQRNHWGQMTITHTGAGQGAIRDCAVRVMSRGRAGSKRQVG